MAKDDLESLEDDEDKKLKGKKEPEEPEEDDEEDESDSESESDAVKDPEDSSTEDKTEEDSESDAAGTEKEREEIRARRRHEKKMKKERDRREKLLLRNTVIALTEKVKELESFKGETTKIIEEEGVSRTKNEMRELADIYKKAQNVMKQAIKDQDGEKFVEAKEISDKAWTRYNILETQHRSAPDKKEESTREAATTEKAAVPVLGEEGKRLAVSWIKKNSSWYDPNANNRESKIVQTLDKELYDEGFDPESKEYWEELTYRAKEVLPHRFRTETARKPQLVGGSGRDAQPATSQEKNLPKEFVQTLKAAGYWENPAKRKAAIKNYYANKKGA